MQGMDLGGLAKQRRKKAFWGAVFAIALFIAMLLALGMGAMSIPARDVFRILFGKLSGSAEILSSYKANEIAVIWDIRLPRILCSMLVGAGLSVAGVIFQSLLQNPLADPYTLGVSTGASFGASLAIYLGMRYGINLPIPPIAFAAALCTLLAVIAIARRSRGLYIHSLLISGIIVSAILSSGISLIKMLAGENVSAIVFWLMGSFSASHWGDVGLATGSILPATLIALACARNLNIMTMGEETARHLGVNVSANTRLYLVLGALITAACVSVSGVIGFVGLVVPHMLRHALGSDNRSLMLLSTLLGSLLLMLADSASRLLSSGEIPVGVITTLLGGPFFIYIFSRNRPSGRR